MTQFLKKWTWLIAAVALLFFAWVFGWGGGPINVLNFDLNSVERIELSCSHPWLAGGRAVVTGAEDIQTAVDTVNSFRRAGNELKFFLRYGFSAGGAVLYEIDLYLTNGERFSLCLCPEAHSNTQMTYWVYQPDHRDRIAKVCSGSLDWFYELHEKYTAAAQ